MAPAVITITGGGEGVARTARGGLGDLAIVANTSQILGGRLDLTLEAGGGGCAVAISRRRADLSG